MIRGIGVLRVSTYSQTLNVQNIRSYLIGRAILSQVAALTKGIMGNH